MIDLPESEPDIIDHPHRKDIQWWARIQRTKFIARRYWWIAAITIMIGVLFQAVRAHRQVPLYSSSARMILNGSIAIPQGDAYSEERDNFYGTQVALMQSPSTLTRAADQVTAAHPDVKPDPNIEVAAAAESKTSIFDLEVTSRNSQYAKLMVNAIMDTYLNDKRGRKTQTTDEALAAIYEEETRLNNEIKEGTTQLLDFEKQNDVVFIEEQSASSANYLVGLNSDLDRLNKSRDLLNMENADPQLSLDLHGDDILEPKPTVTPASINATTNTTNGAAYTSADNPQSKSDTDPIMIEQNRLAKLKIESSQLLVYLKVKHPKMIELSDEIKQEEQFLDVLKGRNQSDRLEQAEVLDLEIKNLQKQITSANASSLKLSQSLAIYHQLKDQINREQSLYNQLAQSVQSVSFNKSLDQEDVGILEDSSAPHLIPVNTLMRLVYGFLEGLMAGVALIYGVSRLDDRITSPMEVEGKFDFPVLGRIPMVEIEQESKRAALLTEEDPRHELLEYYRHLRSSVISTAQMEGNDGETRTPRTLMITSAAPGEGKSSVASNLAIVLAHSGFRVLLIDADLRKGILHQLFALSDAPGLSGFLQRQSTLEESTKPTTVPGLDVIPRGKVFLRAGDLLLGSAISDLIHKAKPKYDVILIDTPPLLAAHDAANLCTKVDGVLFVGRIRASSIRAMRIAIDELVQKKAHILGIVVNAMDAHQPGYFEKYRYKEYYATPVEEEAAV
jgi:succinoglycan biosynthesis transport protein ExoP